VNEERSGGPVLSIVIPAYNEESRLARTFPSILGYLDSLGKPYEVIVVDDGSTDGTSVVVEDAAKANPRIRGMRLAVNSGKGKAVQAGMLAAQGDFVIFTDADLSTPIETTEPFLKHLSNGTEIVVGNRRMNESRLEARQPWAREFLGRIFTRLTRLILGSPVTDQTCGFKGFTRRAAREVFRRQTIPGWAFDAEILHIAHRLGIKVHQEPVTWTNDARSKVAVASACIKSFTDLVTIWFRGVSGRYR
jgi:dolichyl-phosphate beta-glucosyltransferase